MPVAADTNLAIGGQAIVSNTNGDGVNVRGAVGFDAPVLFAAEEGASLHVVGGPNTAPDGTVWYNVEVNGTLGWVVSDYLARPAVAAGATVKVVGTDGNGLRLRDGASLESATLTVIPEGTEISVIGAEVTDGSGQVWANVTYNGQNGFAARDYLAEVTGNASPVVLTVSNPAPAASGIVVGGNAEVYNTNGDGLNLRSDASYGAGVVTVAAEGDVVHVIDGPKTDGEGHTWWGVDYKGTRGWMVSDYLRQTDKAPTQAAQVASAPDKPAEAPAASSIGQQIANTAMQYLGAPYAWGGTTPSGFDCSGFVYYVVNQVTGGGFPRAMDGQVSSGTYVDPDNLQPGDLVFQQNTYQWGLSHVGIYIGDGKFINAANEGTGVVVSNLWDSYWGPRYYTARRIGG